MSRQLHHRQSRQKGFTLSELVISLAVLGLIAAMTIPSILFSLGKNAERARIMETYNIVTNAAFQVTSGALTSDTVINMLRSTLNAQRVCLTASSTNGCQSTTVGFPSEPGFLFQSGAVINGLDNNTTSLNLVTIMSDGTKTDSNELQLAINFSDRALINTFASSTSHPQVNPGQVVPVRAQDVTMLRNLSEGKDLN